MGEVLSIKCGQCDYAITVRLGIGFFLAQERLFEKRRFDDEPVIYSYVKSKKIANRAVKMNNDGAKIDGCSYELYACPNCHYLFNYFWFKLVKQRFEYAHRLEDEIFEPRYICTHCSFELQRVKLVENKRDIFKISFLEQPNINWFCPRCQNDYLIYDEHKPQGDWD